MVIHPTFKQKCVDRRGIIWKGLAQPAKPEGRHVATDRQDRRGGFFAHNVWFKRGNSRKI